MQDVIITAQMQILFHVSTKQLHVYIELAAEYTSVLKILNTHHQNLKNGEVPTFQLELFVPHNDYSKTTLELTPVLIKITSHSDWSRQYKITIQMLHNILLEHLKFLWFGDGVVDIMESLLYVLYECSFDLKMAALDVYVDLLKKNLYCISLPENITGALKSFGNCLEQLTCMVYRDYIKIEKVELKHLNRILHDFFKHYRKELVDNRMMLRMAVFLLTYFVKDVETTLQLPEIVLKTVINVLVEQNVNINEMFVAHGVEKDTFIPKCISAITEKHRYSLLRLISYQTIVEFNLIGGVSSLNVLRRELQKLLHNQKCGALCVVENTFTLLDKVVEELIYIRTSVKRADNFPELFREVDLVKFILSAAKDHMDECKTPLDLDVFYKLLVYLPATANNTDLRLTFNYISYPFLVKSNHSWNYKCKLTQDPLLMKLAASTYSINKHCSLAVSARWLHRLLYLVFSTMIKSNFRVIFNMFTTILNSMLSETGEIIRPLVSLFILYIF